MKISTNYAFSKETNPVAFAMNINIPSANKEENSYGIDYTTAYMGADATQGGKINDKLVVAKKVDDKWVEIKAGTTTYKTELSYDSKATVTFFDGFEVYYKEGTGDEAVYKLPADLWGTSLKLDFKTPTANATGAQGSAATYDAANYTFTKTNFKFKAATPVAATIGNVITSGKYKLLATVGTELKDFELFQAEQQVEIIGTTDAYAANPATLAWNYTNATTGSNVYELKNIDMKDAMTMAKYQELKAMSYNATPDQVGNYVVTIMKGDADKTADFAVDADSFALSSDPQTDSDPMRVNLKFTIDAKDAAKAGEYTVTAKYCIEAGVYNTISVPLTVKAMPELVAGNKLSLTLSEVYDGNLAYTVADDFTKLIPYVEANHKEAFNDKKTFDTFVANLTAGTLTPDDKAALSLDGKAIKVTFSVPFEYGKAYKPSIVLTSSLVDVTVESTCTLTDPETKMTPDENFLTDGVAKTTATLTNTFAVVDKELKNAYYYTGSVQNTTISYEVANEEKKDNAAVLEQYKALKELAKTGTIPAVDASKFLKWNDWNGLSLIIKASLKDNNGIASSFCSNSRRAASAAFRFASSPSISGRSFASASRRTAASARNTALFASCASFRSVRRRTCASCAASISSSSRIGPAASSPASSRRCSTDSRLSAASRSNRASSCCSCSSFRGAFSSSARDAERTIEITTTSEIAMNITPPKVLHIVSSKSSRLEASSRRRLIALPPRKWCFHPTASPPARAGIPPPEAAKPSPPHTGTRRA